MADNAASVDWLAVAFAIASGRVPGGFVPGPGRAYVDPWLRDASTGGPAVPPLPTLKRFNHFHSL